MKIVVGLGNPGRRYEKTPHNAGFMALDVLAGELACRFRKSLRFNARVAKAVYQGEWLWLLKPQTYMNNSGTAVAAFLRYRRAGPDNVVVVLDDADLPLGRLRLRTRGSSGGHKGLESIIGHLGSEEFVRIRIGIGRAGGDKALVDHVLSPFSAAEQRLMAHVARQAAEAVRCVIDDSVENAMNRFNGMTMDIEESD